jgi:hypothetical protein
MSRKKIVLFILPLFVLCNLGYSQAVKTEIVTTASGFQLLRGGQPYFIEGAGGYDYPERLQAYGGNSTRTWGTDANTINQLNDAQARGITVLMGLWVGHENHGFNYNDPVAVQKQLDDFRVLVEMYKDHPAVLGWGIGNEVELGVSNYNLKVWNAINDISEMIHEVDGNHITLTVTAGIDVTKAQAIKERAPDLDMLGVNAYGGIGGVPGTLQAAGWNKPYIITEWGPNGQWEVPKTSFGVTIEQTSTEKADMYKQRYETVINANPGKCLGSYVFLWSNKLEETPTWYSLFLPTAVGEEMEVVDVMQYVWTGNWPANRAPRITSGNIQGKTANQSVVVIDDTGNTATINVTDPEGDALTYEFMIAPAEGNTGTVLDATHTFRYIPNLITEQTANTITFNAPPNFGVYRLYIIARDVHGNAAAMNIPFRVELVSLISTDPEVLFATQDAYLRDGQYETERFGKTDKDRLVTRTSLQQGSGLSRESYMEFNISSLTEGFNDAYLEVYGSSSETTEVDVYGTTGFVWNENTISWSSRFTKQADLLGTTTLVGGAPGAYYRWKVDALIYKALMEEKTKLTFILRNKTETNSTISWSARELRSNPPSLRFDFNGGDLITAATEGLSVTLSVWPNPCTEKVKVTAQKTVTLRLINAIGIVLWTLQAKGETEVDTKNLSAGFYILVAEDAAGTTTVRKLLKQ